MIYFREPAFFRHVLFRLLPLGDFRGVLRPVHHRGFIAPVQQLGHGLAMGAAGAIGVHGRFVLPSGHGPENVARVHQQSAAEKTRAALHLAHGPECVPEKFREIEEGADSQARDGNERHRFLLRLERAPFWQVAAFEQDFGGPGSQVGGQRYAVAGVGAENDCVAGRAAVIRFSALPGGAARDAFRVPVEDRLPGIAEEDGTTPALRESYFF